MNLFGINACEACTSCGECGKTFCRDNGPSPREDQGICSDCSLMLGELGWGRR